MKRKKLCEFKFLWRTTYQFIDCDLMAGDWQNHLAFIAQTASQTRYQK